MDERKKFVLILPKNRTAYNFRGDLLKKIKSKGYDVTVTGPNTDNVDKILALGVAFKEIRMNKSGVNPFADIRYMLELKRFLTEEKPDAVLGYTSKPVIYGSIAAKLAGVRNINAMITGVGYAFIAKTAKAKLVNKIMRILYKTGLGCADNVIFQNRDDMSDFLKYKLVNEKKCSIVSGSGVNMEHFSEQGYPDKCTFFMLSRALKSKGVREYLEACEIVKKKYGDKVRLLYLGAVEQMQDSLSKEEIEPYIKNNLIEYFGETDDVRPFYNMTSVFVLPSYREGTPRTVLEAMAMGKPIITTDTPGCRETVKDGYNGFLVPAKDSNALADRMGYFIDNPKKISAMGENSVRLCRDKFEVNKVNDDMCRIMNI